MIDIREYFYQHFIDGIDEPSAKFYNINNQNLNYIIEENYDKISLLIQNLKEINNKILDINLNPKETILLFEYAGIGDTFHTKLLIQHLELKYKNIVWITNSMIKDLYKNHKNLFLFDNKINNKIRCPDYLITANFLSFIDRYFRSIFNQFPNKIDISYNITLSHRVASQKNQHKRFDQHYYDILGLQRDFNIKHSILHVDDIEIKINKPIIAFEHCSVTFGNLSNLQAYYEIIDVLNKKYDIYLLGGINDPYIENTIDFRGKSLYDCLSVIKKANFFIGRNSANQLLTVFEPNLSIIELDTSNNIFEECKYTNKPIISISTRNNLNYINLIKEIIKNDKNL